MHTILQNTNLEAVTLRKSLIRSTFENEHLKTVVKQMANRLNEMQRYVSTVDIVELRATEAALFSIVQDAKQELAETMAARDAVTAEVDAKRNLLATLTMACEQHQK